MILNGFKPEFSQLVNSVFGIFDLKVSRKKNTSADFAVELNEFELQVLKNVEPFTMTSRQRLSALALACKYLAKANIKGDVVECGVWAGGSIGAAALLLQNGDHERKFWLFDTFEGMTAPSKMDPDKAHINYQKSLSLDGHSDWCLSPIDEVRNNLKILGVNLRACVFVIGDVVQTLRQQFLPDKIALLRLDTDWYESTLAELEILYPRLVNGGVLIIDDYGRWDGCRKAVEEYFHKNKNLNMMIPIDDTGRILIKKEY